MLSTQRVHFGCHRQGGDDKFVSLQASFKSEPKNKSLFYFAER